MCTVILGFVLSLLGAGQSLASDGSSSENHARIYGDTLRPEQGQQCLLQASTKSQKMKSSHKQLASETTPGQSRFSDLEKGGRALKFYVPVLERKAWENSEWSTQIDPGKTSKLEVVRPWLRLSKFHFEGYTSYIQHRLACSNSRVDSSEQADLCYPTCSEEGGDPVLP